jgi:predicted nucleic acid-binding protein
MPPVFIDTNVFVRHLTQDHADFSPKATAFLARIERGDIQARTADTAIFETVFLLEKRYGRARADIRDGVLALVGLPGLALPNKHRLRRVFELYIDVKLSFGDAFHVALMEQLGIEEIATFDRDFDRVPGIRRVDPQ